MGRSTILDQGSEKASARRRRTEAKRTRILEVAMRHFAQHGFKAARVESITAELGIAKGSVFQHFNSKDGLFLEAYRKAASMLPAYMDAGETVLRRGFFATLRYWLGRTGHMLHEDWIPYRVTLLGNYGTELRLRREINRFMVSEDPYGTNAFVQWGIERGEVRGDVPQEMIVSLVDWMMNSFQDALLTQELDPGLFRRGAARPERAAARIDQFVKLLRSAIGRKGAT